MKIKYIFYVKIQEQLQLSEINFSWLKFEYNELNSNTPKNTL